MHRLLAFLVAVAPIYAQVGRGHLNTIDMATNGDGSVLYFHTELARVGVKEPSQGRIYTIGPGGLSLFASAPKIDTMNPAGTNYYWLSQPEVSRDGKVIAYAGTQSCPQYNCASQTTVFGVPGRLAVTVPGFGHLSGNGRYLWVYDTPKGPTTLQGEPAPMSYVLDLETGVSSKVGAYPPGSTSVGSNVFYPATLGRVVADDGTVLVWTHPGVTTYTLCLIKASKEAWCGPSVGFPLAAVDAAAQVVVYEGPNDTSFQPQAIDICWPNKKSCATLADLPGDSSRPMVSADGRRVMFLSLVEDVRQIYVVNTDSTGLRQVTHEAAGIQGAVMSDDGRVAWYWSGSGKLVQTNLDTGEAHEKLPRTPSLDLVAGRFDVTLVPGSIATISGMGFSDGFVSAETVPLPTTLGGVNVSIGGMPAPILSVAPEKIMLQVPWEVPAGPPRSPFSALVEVHAESASPFVPQLSAPGDTATAHSVLVAAFHEDWVAVTADNPAHPGEVVHFYGTGFGPVTAPPPDGIPTPATPLLPTVTPVSCNVGAVLYAGLAPSLVGYYQLDLLLPKSGLPTGPLFLVCGVEGFTLPIGTP